MPSINKLRVANVNFKDNSRRYDDVIIPVNGLNTIIDGENGDGKTLYAQCAFQTIIPNSYFHPANKIARLFEDNNNTTIHSMIEWELDKGNEYDFLITGFCAKDIKKENEEAQNPFEYFNYIILYKHDLKFSVESIPLKTEKDGKTSRMGYKQLKEHLRKLGENEKGCFVKIFSSKKDYLNFIYNYGINEAEWRLLFDTNRQEGGAENYFTTEFKKPKDLITKKIVPIIESINRYRLGEEMSNEQLAKSLLDINKTIKQLTEKTQRLNELNIVEDCLNRITGFNDDLKRALDDKNATFVEIVKGYNKEVLIIKEISDKISGIKSIKKELEDESANIREIKEDIRRQLFIKDDEKEKLELDLKEVDKIEKILDNRAKKESLFKDVEKLKEEAKVVLDEIEKLQLSKNEFDEKVKELQDLETEKRAENLYLEYKDIVMAIQQKQLKLDNFNRSNDELLTKKKEAESMYLYALNRLEETLKENIASLDLELNNIKDNIDATLKSLVASETELNSLNSTISFNEDEINRLKEDINYLLNKENGINIDNDNLIVDIKSLVEFIKDNSNNLLTESVEQLEKAVKSKDICKIKEYLLKDVSIQLDNISKEIVSSINKLKEERLSLENNTLKNELENEMDKIQLEIKCGFLEEKELSKEIGELQSSIKSNDFKIESVMKNLKEYKNSISSIANILSELDVEDRFECEIKLNADVSVLKNNIFDLNTKIKELDSKLIDLNNNEGLSLSKELLRNFDIVSNTYSSAMLGRDFIKELPIEEKDFYLSKSTLIPYAIVLNEKDYQGLLKNKTIQDKMGDFLTPIINLTAIKNVDKLDESTVYFNTLSKEAFIDEDRIFEEIKKVELEISKLEKELHKVEEELIEKESQLKEISIINAKYEADYEDVQTKELVEYKNHNSSIVKDIDYKKERLLKVECERKTLESSIEDIKKQIIEHENYLKIEISRINKSIDDLQEANVDNNSKIDALDKIEDKSCLYILNTEQLSEYKEKRNKSNEEIATKAKSIEECVLKIKDVKMQISSLKSKNIELDELKKDKDNIKSENMLRLKEVASYKAEIPLNTQEKETILSVKELRNQVKIFNRNYEKEYSLMEELENEIKESYEKCSRKKSEIESSKVSFDKLDSKSDVLIYNDINVFDSIEKRLKAVQFEIDGLVKLVEDSTKTKIEIETTIKNKISDANNIDTYDDVFIEEGYNVEEKRDEINCLINSIKTEKKELDNSFKEYTDKEYEYREQIDDLSSDLSKEQDTLRRIETCKENTEILISSNNIDKTITTEIADNINFVTKEASKKIEWHNNRAEIIKAKHKRDIEETSKKLENSVFEFVSVLKDILPPNTVDEAITQNKSISSSEGYLYYLNQEKESLSKELEDLSLMKKEFITKCVYNVESLIEKLKKLSKQSTVVLNDKKIKLLDLKLYELNSEQKVEKMTNHINKLLNDIDNKLEENPEECIKLLNNELTASKLLEQGVRNINNCEVNIYIPDSVNVEDGYYEKWGGGASGGQRSTMYFTMVMALIVFIRESSSLNGATENTKVLFGDGPFRGAAALYLWEPIFKMMQENNIQFIVTNYKTPAHLTNLFSSRALLAGVETQLNGRRIVQNELAMDSVFKENTKSLRGENILVKYEDYKIPVVKKTAVKEVEVDDSQLSLYDLYIE